MYNFTENSKKGLLFLYPNRISQLLLVFILLASLPFAGFAQDMKTTKLTLHLNDQLLKTVLGKIEEQSALHFSYAPEVGSISAVSVSAENKSAEEVLKDLSKRYAIQFRTVGSMIAVSRAASEAKPATPKKDPGRIIGKVIDEETGDPLSEVTIRIGNKGFSSGSDGTFSITMPKGTYEAEISYVGYGTKQVTDIEVKDDGTFELTVSLKREKNTLTGVVVKSSARKETINALYVRQKNEAGIINGITRQQIAALPDKNVGETLKRISGVSTNENRRVVVRGIAERYNIAMMDGSILPSTDVQVRDFEFDIIPSNLIDNVIVSKTSTPDMSFGFGGGLVQVNTFAIPHQNFTTFGFGTKYIDGSTGKEFLGYGRGKNDYLGFDDGSRDHFPKDMILFNGRNYNPQKPNQAPEPGTTLITPEMIAAQNKRIGGLERMGARRYTAAPGQNYQFSLGRTYQFKEHRFGFVGSVSYRNEQSIDDIPRFERGNWEKPGTTSFDAVTGKVIAGAAAKQYNFSTTWGALFNMGWSYKNHKITSRNFYSRVFNNQFSRIIGFGNEIGFDSLPAIREYDRPKFIDLLQNRINGEHTFGAFKIEWNVSRNKLENLEKDAVEAWLGPSKTLNEVLYNVIPSGATQPGTGTFNRAQYYYKEINKSAEAALSYQMNLLGQKQVIKTGYQFLDRHGVYDWTILPIGTLQPSGSIYPFVPVQKWGQFLDFKDPLKDLFYFPAEFSMNGYEGKNTNHAFYGMLDNRFTKWLRLVWGVRTEYYKYEKLKSGANDLVINQMIERAKKNRFVDPETGKIVTASADPEDEEKTWRYLPSASLTVTPLKNFNIRAAYSQSVVRPALIENSRMIRYDPAIGAYRMNEGVLSTLIDHYDFRLEWYPKPGEVISAGFFYKYFDKPVEIYRNVPDATGRVYVVTQNSDWAKVHGWEFDLRKSLGFIQPAWKFLNNLYVSGNLTLQSSSVQSSQFAGRSLSDDKYGRNYVYRTKNRIKENRPLYGQVPVLYNLGLQYDGNRFGANIAFNHMGYKTFATGMSPNIVEYERPRNQLDAQLSYAFLKDKKLTVRLNMSNLLNDPYRFYINNFTTYKYQDRWKGLGDSEIPETEWDEVYEWKPGFSRKYEEGVYEVSADGKTKTRTGDKDTFIRKIGASFSISVAWTF